jgi:hypothetical protein
LNTKEEKVANIRRNKQRRKTATGTKRLQGQNKMKERNEVRRNNRKYNIKETEQKINERENRRRREKRN